MTNGIHWQAWTWMWSSVPPSLRSTLNWVAYSFSCPFQVLFFPFFASSVSHVSFPVATSLETYSNNFFSTRKKVKKLLENILSTIDTLYMRGAMILPVVSWNTLPQPTQARFEYDFYSSVLLCVSESVTVAFNIWGCFQVKVLRNDAWVLSNIPHS